MELSRNTFACVSDSWHLRIHLRGPQIEKADILIQIKAQKKSEPVFCSENSVRIFLLGAANRDRTGTVYYHRGILSPLRLPIPPQRQALL